MTTRERIISFLQNHPEGTDDDELARMLNLPQRQQANARCRELEREGFVQRRRINEKIHNFWVGNAVPTVTNSRINTKIRQEDASSRDHWYWEGNVQSRIVSYLVSQKYSIRSSADTASHQQGIDIIAEKNGKTLWVSVKGYPAGTPKTNATLQAGHWFKQVIFDMIEYRERDKDSILVVGLPDFPKYHSLAKKISWFKPVGGFCYFWVDEAGEVIVE